MKTIFLLTTSFLWCLCMDEKDFYGCYKYIGTVPTVMAPRSSNCVTFCKGRFFRYANINDTHCSCVNVLGEQINSTLHCNDVCNNCEMRDQLQDTYFTGNLVPGPPRNFLVDNITNTSAHLSWTEPESYVDIVYYEVKANILDTYSSYSPKSPDWKFSNNTSNAEIITLHPASKYNLTIRTVSTDGAGPWTFSIINTKLGNPNPPPKPVVIERAETTMRVNLNGAVNNNGPVTAYQVIVINDDAKQGFQPDKLRSAADARQEGYDFYITAELSPKDIDKEFVVGDGKYYGKFYNAPLNPAVDYNIILGLISRLNDSVKYAYSDPNVSEHGIIVLNITEDPLTDSPVVVITLSVAIALLSCLLLLGLVVFFVLKRRIQNRRQRLTDNQELTLQGPMIEIENSGYIPEEEQPVNHYKILKQKVKTVSYHLVQLDPNVLLGSGKFGNVNAGTIREDKGMQSVSVYTIHDKRMQPDEKRSMLRDLNLLIKTTPHPNVLGLMGTSESAEVVCVLLEYATLNLKDLLLSSRNMSNGRFSDLYESQALDIVIGIANGLDHLGSCGIVHKNVCARNVMLGRDLIPKVGGYGLTQYYRSGVFPDTTRWTACEVFKGLPHTSKSDVWSFSCLAWEVCSLGGTPFGALLNNEIPVKATRGVRPSQLQCISSNLYQLMLNCWQLDSDERPVFKQLISEIAELRNDHLTQHLSFNVFPGFQYEQYIQNLELSE